MWQYQAVPWEESLTRGGAEMHFLYSGLSQVHLDSKQMCDKALDHSLLFSLYSSLFADLSSFFLFIFNFLSFYLKWLRFLSSYQLLCLKWLFSLFSFPPPVMPYTSTGLLCSLHFASTLIFWDVSCCFFTLCFTFLHTFHITLLKNKYSVHLSFLLLYLFYI